MCGSILTAQRDTPALGHDWDGGVMALEPTCVKDGTWVSTCVRCGAKQEETVRAVGHTPEPIPGKAAPCQETGLTEGSRCAVCGEILEKQETLPLTGHTFGEWTQSKQPGCVEPGEQRRACAVCGASETRPLDPLGHDWDEGTLTREPGLLTPGEITYACRRCGAEKTEALPKKTPQTSLFNLLRDIPHTEEGDASDLILVTQPEGGLMDHEGGSFTLTAEAAGGTPPYTYEWFDALHNPVYNGWGNDWHDWEWARPKQPGVYYCTVTEAAGLTRTVRMEVGYDGIEPFIAKQPQNVNLDYRADNWYVAELNVTAYSGSGLAGALAYEWQKKGADGWYWVGNGPKLTVVQDGWEGMVSGKYRCHIIDGQTGGEIYTNEAFVRINLRFAEAMGGKSTNWNNWNKAVVVFLFEGGTPPYTIGSVYRSNYKEWNPYAKVPSYFEYETTGYPVSEEHYSSYMLADSLQVTLRDVPYSFINWKGGYEPSLTFTYYVVVKDVWGQVAKGEFKLQSIGYWMK